MPLTIQNSISGEYFSRFLDETGDGTGNKQATGNYAAGVTDFLITPTTERLILVGRMIVNIADIGTPTPGEYGNLGGALINGVNLLKLEGATILANYMDGLPVLTNGHWARTSFDVTLTSAGGVGENYVDDRWSFNKTSNGIPLRSGQSLAIRLNDDFTNLEGHTFCVQGEIF